MKITIEANQVRVKVPLSHPRMPRMKLLPGEDSRDNILLFLGATNYEFALQQGWIEEINENHP